MATIGAIAAALLVVQVALPAQAQLASHRAFYQLSLDQTVGGLVDAQGAFAIEWQASCGGTTSQQHLWFVGRTDEGANFDYDVRFSTWESSDNSKLRFTMRSFTGGELVEEFRGTASMPDDGGAGQAVYSVPDDLELRLPPGTIFPTRHLRFLIEQARAGERVAVADLFDGAGDAEDALATVTAVIGDALEPPVAEPNIGDATPSEPGAVEPGAGEPSDRVEPGAGKPKGRDARDGGPAAAEAWPMALAYHPFTSADVGTPAFELSFDLAADGVMRRVLLDYGDFALRARLDKIEMLKAPSCD